MPMFVKLYSDARHYYLDRHHHRVTPVSHSLSYFCRLCRLPLAAQRSRAARNTFTSAPRSGP